MPDLSHLTIEDIANLIKSLNKIDLEQLVLDFLDVETQIKIKNLL